MAHRAVWSLAMPRLLCPQLKALVAGSPITTLGGTQVRFQGQPADPTPFTGANMSGAAPGFMAGGPQPGPVEAWKEGCSACQAEPAFVGSGNRCLFACEDVTMFPVVGWSGETGWEVGAATLPCW